MADTPFACPALPDDPALPGPGLKSKEKSMDALPTVGKFLYAIPMAVFGVMHFMMAQMMAGMVPSFVPGGIVWVYITGIALIAAALAIMIDKHAVLAARLLGLMLLSFALTIHLPALMGGDQAAMAMVLKDTALAGAAFVLSGVLGGGAPAAEV